MLLRTFARKTNRSVVHFIIDGRPKKKLSHFVLSYFVAENIRCRGEQITFKIFYRLAEEASMHEGEEVGTLWGLWQCARVDTGNNRLGLVGS